MNLLKEKSFWEVSINTQVVSWMWRKILKLHEVAKAFHMKVVGNGRHTSFWYDRWSELGNLSGLLGETVIIDMGIRRGATLEEAIQAMWRRRRHRSAVLNEIEKELEFIKRKQSNAGDFYMWR